jgi:hypothetical protein
MRRCLHTNTEWQYTTAGSDLQQKQVNPLSQTQKSSYFHTNIYNLYINNTSIAAPENRGIDVVTFIY